MPDAVLRTTCLVGFPGETEDHFQHLCDFCEENRFDHLGAFVYSPEEGTPAYDMDDVPPQEVAEERHARLMQLQKQIVDQKNHDLVGTTATVLLEGETEGQWRGRSARQAPEVDGNIYIDSVPEGLGLGDFVNTTLTAASDYDLQAEVIPNDQ